MQCYIRVRQGKSASAGYLGTCEPTTNFVVEISCGSVWDETLKEIRQFNADTFAEALASDGDDLLKKAYGLLFQMLNKWMKLLESHCSVRTGKDGYRNVFLR